MDGEFKKIEYILPNVECNTTAAKEHVSEAGRMIQTIKERTRGLNATLPFEHMPQRIKIELLYFMVFWHNTFPIKSGVSFVFLPWELLVQWQLNNAKHCIVLPRTYCEAHDEPSPCSNTMVACTHETIALGPTGNLQGSVKFHCLNTGRILQHRSFTPYPMPDQIIKKVNCIGAKEK
jgi:hypothetical protein